MKERRRGRRILIRRMVDLSWDEEHAVGWGRDISVDGMYIQCHKCPDPGENVNVTVRFRRAGTVSIAGLVQRVDEGGLAIRFAALGQFQTDTIRKVVAGQ